MNNKSTSMAILANLIWPGAGYLYLEFTVFSTLLVVLVPVLLLGLFVTIPFGLAAVVFVHVIMGFDLNSKCQGLNEAARLKELRRCNRCAETVHKNAKVCKHCGAEF